MTTENHNPPAFPTLEMHPHGLDLTSPGMTLRDYFAVHASADDLRTHMEIIREKQHKQYGASILPDNWASIARYMHADAMLEARIAAFSTGAQNDN